MTEGYPAVEPVVGGRYRLGEVIGYGGMAEVHRGVDTRLGRTVAVKLLRASLASDATFQARFRQEAQSAASLNHPNVISVYDFGDGRSSEGAIAGLPYIVMEFVEGRTLRDILRQERRLLPERALEITAEILSALDYSHRMGIIHRDIKPANVMVTPRGDVKVMDFGIARAVADTSSSMTQTSAVIGTAQYLSPEQARGQTVDARSDLYSTGCLLYELLTGRPPFTADSPVALALAHVRETAVPPDAVDPSVPPAASAITMTALAKSVDDRYASAWEMREDIERALAGQPVHARPVSTVAAPATDDARTELMRPAIVGRAPVVPAGPGAESAGEQTGWSVPTAAAMPVVALPPAGSSMPPPPGSVGRARPPAPPPRSRRTALTIGLVILVLLVLAGLAYGFYAISHTGGTPSPAVSSSPSAAASSAAPSPSPTASSPSATPSSPSASASTAAPITIPGDLVGAQLSDAESRLTSLGLTYTTSSTNSSQPANTVLMVTPGPSSVVASGQSVAIVYASGNTVIPDVRGLSVDAATQLLQQDNFLVDPVLASGVGNGTVTRETPAGNQVAQQGSTVTIFYKATPSASPTAPASSAPAGSSAATTPAPSKTGDASGGRPSGAPRGSAGVTSTVDTAHGRSVIGGVVASSSGSSAGRPVGALLSLSILGGAGVSATAVRRTRARRRAAGRRRRHS